MKNRLRAEGGSPSGIGQSRLSPGCRWLLWLVLLLGLPRLSMAIILYSTGDPSHNTNAPTGTLTNSGWQYEGAWGVFLGTPIAPKYFITAAHVGGSVGDVFHFNGVDYTTTAMFSDTNTDLRVWRVCGTFPTFAPIYSTSDEAGKTVVVFGRGTQRGAEVMVPGGVPMSLKGWQWGASDNVERWGTNVVSSIIGAQFTGGYGDLLQCDFNANGGADEAQLSVGDSGGAVFIKHGGVWKLAGINLSVDGPYNTSTNGGGFDAAIFDEGGLYTNPTGTNWVLTTDLAGSQPGSFYATRVSARLAWINSVLQASPPPDPLPQLFSAGNVAGPYADTPGAVVDTNTKTVTVPVPSGTQFYRLRACDPSQIMSITNNGSMLILTYQ